MNARKLVLTTSLISIFSISVSALAQEKDNNPELMARLERIVSESDQKVRTLNGAPKQKWLLHEMRVKELIDKLKAGQPVEPKEIDAILTEHSR